MRELLKSVREYKKQAIMTPVLVILEVLMEVLIPLLMANIIDIGIQNGDLGYIAKTGLLLIVMAMVALAFGAAAGRTGAVAAAGFAKNLRKDIFYKIQKFSFKNIDHFSTSSLVTRHPSFGAGADYDCPFSGHDAYDQQDDFPGAFDYGANLGRCPDFYRKKGTSAFHPGI